MSERTVASLILALALAVPPPALAQDENSQITGFASIPWGADRTAIEAEHGTPTAATTSRSDTTRLVYEPHELLGRPAKMTFTLVRDSLVGGEYRLEGTEDYCLGSFRPVAAAILRANPDAVVEPQTMTSIGASTVGKSENVQCGAWLAMDVPLVGSQTFRDPTGSAIIKVLWVGREEQEARLTVNYHHSDPLDEEVKRAFGPP